MKSARPESCRRKSRMRNAFQRKRREAQQKNNQRDDGPCAARAIKRSPAVHQRRVAETEKQKNRREENPAMPEENTQCDQNHAKRNRDAAVPDARNTVNDVAAVELANRKKIERRRE